MQHATQLRRFKAVSENEQIVISTQVVTHSPSACSATWDSRCRGDDGFSEVALRSPLKTNNSS